MDGAVMPKNPGGKTVLKCDDAIAMVYLQGHASDTPAVPYGPPASACRRGAVVPASYTDGASFLNRIS